MSRKLPLALALALVSLIPAVPGAVAATPATPFQPLATPNPEPQPGGRWGERLVVARDENGDGVNDIFTATPSSDQSFRDQGRVYLLSGKDRSILRAIDSPEPQGGTAAGPGFGFAATTGSKFGFYISVPGDLNGDGKDDVVAGTDAQNVFVGTGPGGTPNTAPCGAPEPNGCNEGQGKAWAFSGSSGAVLYAINNPDPQGTTANRARFGSRIGRAGDVTGDGVSDLVIGASSNDVPAGCGNVTPVGGCRKDQGQAYIFNGATGALVRPLNIPTADLAAAPCAANCGQLGIAVQSPGDTNGDGFPDQLVDAGNYNGVGRMYLFSGKDGSVLLKIDDPQPQSGAFFGFQDAAPDSPGDVNGDGAPDLYAHGFQQDGPTGIVDQGRAWVFSGKDGTLLRTIDDPTPDTGGTFGFSMSTTDYNKDATPDLYIGQAPHSSVPESDQNGGTYVFDGRDGSLLKTLEVPVADRQPLGPGGPSLGFSSAAPGDLNGDGEPDYLGGAPFFDEGGDADSGRIYAFMSSSNPPAAAGTPPAAATPAPPTVLVPTVLPRVKIAGITARVAPRRDRRAPYSYLVSGTVRRPVGIPASACKSGRVSVQFQAGSKTVSSRRVTLRTNCTFRSSVTFRSRSRLGRSGALKVKVRFLGNARFKPASARTLSARAG